jgi:cytochrome c oxidase subunit 3
MSAIATPLPETPEAWKLPYRGKVGMACLIFAESAIFTIFVVAYLFYVGKSLTGPTPREVLETPIFYTICLLSSSLTIHFAGKLLERGQRAAFLLLWLITITLGAISTNLFGTTYYSLVGLHAFHVTAGLIMLSIVLLFGLAGRVGPERSARIDVLSLYWHFVDAVWVVVFTVVYVLGR